jgi:hypothetical protein
MRHVVIGGTNWIDQFPKRKRGAIMRMIFSLAADYHYDIVVAGQHWPK